MYRKPVFLLFVSFILSALSACQNTAPNTNQTAVNTNQNQTASKEIPNRKWWKEAVVYQIYPRSFKDTNGDGIGDLKGITEKLDYIKSLGIDAVWLNPIFSSPNDDMGYDVSDYRNIMKEFGTMEDFDVMLKGFHERGIKVVLDLVANHSSDEHFWFQEAKKSRDNPYRDYYHWWNEEDGKPPKRVSFFDPEGDGWQYEPNTKSYYLHYFSDKQPDLNWENPKLREEMYSMMKFWFDKGVDGFRMDVIHFISKDKPFREIPAEFNGDFGKFYGSGPKLHDYIQEMNREVLSKYDVMTLGEAGATKEDAHKFVDEERRELNMIYHYEGVNLGYLPDSKKIIDPKGWKLSDFKDIYTKWDTNFAEKGWNTVYLGNHDQPRMVTRWGNDSPEFREVSSKMLTTFLLTQRATPYYYFGDELGMNNIKFDKIEDYKDIESINWYKQIKAEGGDLTQFLESQKIAARDNGRTPFQWNATANAGFSTGTPWLKVNPNYEKLNAEAQEKDENSVLNYFRKLVKFRKENPILIYGKYTLLDRENEDVYSYTRELDGKKFLVLLNFKPKESEAKTGLDLSKAKVLMSNYADAAASEKLKPYQAVILEITN
ncbi:MAG: alpha-glucosidase [Pyrinomonadaceae bacterium]|nr:alpha-glucosidase [Pyrinomonadaceae bacterium]